MVIFVFFSPTFQFAVVAGGGSFVPTDGASAFCAVGVMRFSDFFLACWTLYGMVIFVFFGPTFQFAVVAGGGSFVPTNRASAFCAVGVMRFSDFFLACWTLYGMVIFVFFGPTFQFAVVAGVRINGGVLGSTIFSGERFGNRTGVRNAGRLIPVIATLCRVGNSLGRRNLLLVPGRRSFWLGLRGGILRLRSLWLRSLWLRSLRLGSPRLGSPRLLRSGAVPTFLSLGPRLGRFLAVSPYLLGRDGVIYKIG